MVRKGGAVDTAAIVSMADCGSPNRGEPNGGPGRGDLEAGGAKPR